MSGTTPVLYHPKGDWFMGKRLPEFKTGWKDPEKRMHHLKIIGRHMLCQEHNSPIMRGVINVPNPDGSYDLACLELRSHWPRIFTAGDEFLDLHSEYRTTSKQSKIIGNLNIEGSNTVNQIRMHILATMITILAEHLDSLNIAFRSWNAEALAAGALKNIPGLGKSTDPVAADVVSNLNIFTRHYDSFGYPHKVFRSKLRRWAIETNWWKSPALETTELPEYSPSISI
jgi:hypothetical protein